jgi:hypothetical protein
LAAASSPGGIYVLQQIPALTLQRAGANLAISWPSSSAAAGLALWQNFDLTSTNWSRVVAQPGLTNNFYELLVPPTAESNCFYRLQEP